MKIPVRIISNISGRIVEGNVTPRRLLELTDEADLITELTICDCEPEGETYVFACNCDEEWMDCKVLIGDEIPKNS